MFSQKQSGFGFVGVLVVIVVVALIGVTGYYVYNNVSGEDEANSSQTENTQEDVTAGVPEAPEVKSEADLDKATEALDSANLDSLDSEMSSIETEVDKY